MDKRIGFFKGLKATWGFKPYFHLLMLELFSWLSLQVRNHHVEVGNYFLMLITVYPRELGSIYQVFCWTGEPISLPDSSASGQLCLIHANVATCHSQVWQEDHFLCGHVDAPASTAFLAVC